MTSCGWLWLYAGVGLMLAELLAPGFVVFFFGLSAASVGLCRFAFGEALTPTWQLAAFSAFSVLYLLSLRRWLKRVFMGTVTTSATDFEDDMVGRFAKVTAAIAPPKTGRVMVGDAEWTASAAAPIAAGADVKVVARENLTLRVEPV